MDGNFKDFVQSGRSLITDTKTPKVKSQSVKQNKVGLEAPVTEKDPHRVLIRRCIDDRIKKSEVIEEFKKFIVAAEAAL